MLYQQPTLNLGEKLALCSFSIWLAAYRMKSAAPGSINETRIDCEYIIRVSSLQCKLSFLTVFERLPGALILLIENLTVSQLPGGLSIQTHMHGQAECKLNSVLATV